MLPDRSLLISLLILPLALLVLPGDAVAQGGIQNRVAVDPSPASSTRISVSLLASRKSPLVVRAPRGTARAARRGSRDSLKNGTIIGAVAGAVALGAFAAVVCKVQQEPGGPSCVGDTFRIAAVGAAIGAGAGLAIDAALSYRGGVTLAVGIRF